MPSVSVSILTVRRRVSARQHSAQTYASSTWDWGSPGKRLSFLSFLPSSPSHLLGIDMAETHVLPGARNVALSNSTINAAGTIVRNINTRHIPNRELTALISAGQQHPSQLRQQDNVRRRDYPSHAKPEQSIHGPH